MIKEIFGSKGYTIESNGVVRNKKGEKLYIKNRNDGYREARVILLTGKRKYFKVHRLLALAFIHNNNHGDKVNHKNGNRSDNRLENLEWCTQKENLFHAKNITGNSKVISRKKIIELYENSIGVTLDDFVSILLKKCK